MKSDSLVQLPVKFCDNALTRLLLLAFYFWFAFFQPFDLEASSGGLSVLVDAAVLIDLVGFTAVSSHSGL